MNTSLLIMIWISVLLYILPKNVTFVNSKNFTDNIVVEYNELFRSLVNTSYSSIQIPTDIFEKGEKQFDWSKLA